MTFFTSALNRREQLGLNSILLFLGPRGVGKSYGCLKVAEWRDSSFIIDRVVFDLESFLARIQELRGGFKWIVFDELGLEIAAREWLSNTNKIMSYVTQSFRFTKINLAISTPSPHFVDINTRNLADFWVIMKARGKARVYSVRQNPFSYKPIQTPFLGEIRFSLPSAKMQKDYENKRQEVMNSKYVEYLKRAKVDREKQSKKPRDLNQEALKLYQEGRLTEEKGRNAGKVSAYKIMELMKVSQAIAYRIKYFLEKG